MRFFYLHGGNFIGTAQGINPQNGFKYYLFELLPPLPEPNELNLNKYPQVTRVKI